MATTKLREALKLAQAASSIKTPKVCRNQSNALSSALGLVSDFLKEIRCRPQLIDADSVIWEQLGLAVRRGLQLIQSYTDSKWILTALLHEESRQDFEDVCTDLYDYIQLVSALSAGSMSEALQACLVTSKFRGAAVQDRKQMVERTFGEAGGRDLEALTFLSGKLLASEGSNAQLMIDHRQVKLSKMLGSGSYSAVYEASWLGYTLAVKVFHPGDATFPKELAALALSKHPNIVRVVGSSYDTDKQQRCLVMEMMETDLENFIVKLNSKRKTLDGGCPLPLVTMVSIMLQVARAMAFLHSTNIFHRDLKPQNVLLCGKQDEGYRAKVADFGLARTQFITSRCNATPNRGTKVYGAPEVWETPSEVNLVGAQPQSASVNKTGQHSRYSRKSDVYSYGMLCYQLVTGKKPFTNSDAMRPDFMQRVRGGMRPEFNADCHPELAELIKSCWATEPAERPVFLEVIDKLKLIRAGILSSTACIIAGPA